MLDAVFISDLHLHPNETVIMERFSTFIDWAGKHTRSLYILGDFFHAWAGDDGLEPWSKNVAQQLHCLAQRGIKIYYLHGNRDFLLGKAFARLAGMTLLQEPAVVDMKGKIMLVHGDRYCLNDKSHQRFRKVTRARWFAKIFLALPYRMRKKIVHKIREYSQFNQRKKPEEMEIVVQPMLEEMENQKVSILIHGHIHKPGLINHCYNDNIYSQYILSDWDNNPRILCFDNANGFKFIQIPI